MTFFFACMVCKVIVQLDLRLHKHYIPFHKQRSHTHSSLYDGSYQMGIINLKGLGYVYKHLPTDLKIM